MRNIERALTALRDEIGQKGWVLLWINTSEWRGKPTIVAVMMTPWSEVSSVFLKQKKLQMKERICGSDFISEL